MATSSSSTTPPPPPTPPSEAKKGFLRRVLPFLLVANLAVGVYVFVRSAQKDSPEKDKKAVKVPPVQVSSTGPTVPEKTSAVEPPVKFRPPIPEHEQRELFKWILEEKRKVKPRDSTEKKKINEEKALLKDLIRAKSIPTL